MRRASKEGVIGTERHLYHVEKTFIYLAFFNEIPRRLLGGHLNWRVIVGGTDDEIRLGYNAALIGPVVMRESPARRFDNSDSFVRNLRRLGMNVRRRDLWIGHQFHPTLCRI